MPVIRRLPQDVASRIAAGEVIERPASVLKELIENSLDAGASRVDVEALGAGAKLLRVSDDGNGMDAKDCREAFERHATSKISRLEDIDSLSTFGFRGEALFSIAAVSRAALTSSLRGTRTAWRVECEGGRLSKEREAPPAPGTTIEVRDLFFNTPARAKFLKSEASERGHLLRVVEEAALANPGVAFSYKSEGRAVLRYPGGAEARGRAREVLGGELADGLIPAEQAREGFALAGLVSSPDALNPARTFQFVFVNRRPVASRIIQQGLYRAYEPFRPRNRHPVAVLYLDLPPDSVDVNVHPTKREVRFRSEGAVFEAVASAVSRALLKSKGIPTLSDVRREAPAWIPPARAAFEPGPALLVKEPAPEETPRPAPVRPWFDEGLRYLGQIERSYLLFEASGGLLVVDQHAAQERILFERYLKEIESGRPQVQKLMLPVPIELPASSIQKVLARRERMNRAGFDLEPFSKTVLHVTAIPQAFKKTGDVKELVHRMLEGLLSPGAAAADTKYDAAATVACKAAVKAHDPLGEREALRLAEDLRSCADATCCPHGRPTMLSMTRDELARRFKRPGAPPL